MVWFTSKKQPQITAAIRDGLLCNFRFMAKTMTTPIIASLRRFGAALVELLKNHYRAPLIQTFAQFKLGAMLFFLGMVVIYMAHQLLQESLGQELAMLLGLTIALAGFAVAMLAHVRMIISRLWNFFIQK